jgi:hypothetical protein
MMEGFLATGGELLRIKCGIPWVARLIQEAAGDQLQRGAAGAPCTVSVRIEADRRPFDLRDWEPLTRGAYKHGPEVVMEDACTSGFDLHVRSGPDQVEFTFRWRPPARDRLAAWALRSRFHLLARAVLLQYPVLWWATARGRAPLHVSACAVGMARPLLAGPGGVGKSTLLIQQLMAGGRATGDNLCVGDGITAWGVVEPLRWEGLNGRRMPHGRREAPWEVRLPSLEPDRVLVVRRGAGELPVIRPCDTDTAVRSLVTGTYMAGELRRYWAFAATLAAGTGIGPAHPPVGAVASAFAARLPSFEIVLPGRVGPRLTDLLQPLEAIA